MGDTHPEAIPRIYSVRPTSGSQALDRTDSMISEGSVRRAISHLGSFGDTDLFPRLPEMRCFIERPGTIAKDCAALNIGHYHPTSAIETLTPKSWLGFRIAHQLTASDNVI